MRNERQLACSTTVFIVEKLVNIDEALTLKGKEKKYTSVQNLIPEKLKIEIRQLLPNVSSLENHTLVKCKFPQTWIIQIKRDSR